VWRLKGRKKKDSNVRGEVRKKKKDAILFVRKKGRAALCGAGGEGRFRRPKREGGALSILEREKEGDASSSLCLAKKIKKSKKTGGARPFILIRASETLLLFYRPEKGKG